MLPSDPATPTPARQTDMALASHLRSSGKLLSARRKQVTPHVGLPRYRVPAIDIPRRLAQSRALSAELAEVLSSPSVKETTQFLLEHPIATLASAVAALYIVPRLVEVRPLRGTPQRKPSCQSHCVELKSCAHAILPLNLATLPKCEYDVG